MRIRFVPLALLLCAGMWLPVQTPAQAKPNYNHKFKARKVHVPKGYKAHKVASHKAPGRH